MMGVLRLLPCLLGGAVGLAPPVVIPPRGPAALPSGTIATRPLGSRDQRSAMPMASTRSSPQLGPRLRGHTLARAHASRDMEGNLFESIQAYVSSTSVALLDPIEAGKVPPAKVEKSGLVEEARKIQREPLWIMWASSLIDNGNMLLVVVLLAILAAAKAGNGRCRQWLGNASTNESVTELAAVGSGDSESYPTAVGLMSEQPKVSVATLSSETTSQMIYGALVTPTAEEGWQQNSRRQMLCAGGAALSFQSTRDQIGVEAENNLEKARLQSYDLKLARIYDTSSRLYHNPMHRLKSGPVSLLKDLPRDQIICVGEEHNHFVHHVAEMSLLKSLVTQTPPKVPLALGLEMFEGIKDHQRALDEFVFGSDDLDDLKRRVNWRETWGWKIHYWAKILNFAKLNGMRIVGLNAPSKAYEFVERHGIAGLIGRPGFPEIDLGDHYHLQRFISEQPSRAMAEATTEAQVRYAYESQVLREEWMADKVAQQAKHQGGGRVFVIAGRSHIAGRCGVPNRISKRLNGWANPLTVIMQGTSWDPKHDVPRPKSLPTVAEADWVWYTEHNKQCPLF